MLWAMPDKDDIIAKFLTLDHKFSSDSTGSKIDLNFLNVKIMLPFVKVEQSHL